MVTLSMRMNSVTARARVLEFVCIFGHDANHILGDDSLGNGDAQLRHLATIMRLPV